MTLVSTVQADMNSLVEIPDDVRFVKIDVERREYQVLKGMTRIIGGGRPVIILENLTPEISEYFRKFEYTVVNVVGTPIVGAPAFPNVLAYPNAMDPIRLTEAELDALVSQAEALTPRAED